MRREAQRDEVGYDYTRWYTRVAGPVAPAAAPDLEQRDLQVMFQRIIYDGLVGDDFLRRFTVTFDLPRARLILGPKAPARGRAPAQAE